MNSARRVRSAIVVILAIVGVATAPAFAGSAHPLCSAKQHDCGKTPSIRPCCCGDQHGDSEQSGPVTAKTRLNANIAQVAAVVMAAALPGPRQAIRPQACPRAEPVDRPTLFAHLLI